MHLFNSCAILDRCDFSSFADSKAISDLLTYDIKKLLPNNDDIQQLIKNASVIVGRLLTKHVPGFSQF